jgi:type IV pilus assembly protein PilX
MDMHRIDGSKSTPMSAQRGAALITALLLLVVMTILAVTVMQMSRVQERMAGNTRDLNVAFEAAEAAVRNAETLIGVQTTAPAGCDAAPCKFWAMKSVVDVASQSKDWWNTNGTGFADPSGRPMANVAKNPQFVIEQLGFVRSDGGVTTGVMPVGRDFYQITGRSTGASGLANSVVQTTYARKY